MKHKYISTQSGELLNYLNEREMYCFNFIDAQTALPESKEGTVRELLSDMIRRGLLMRLKDGVYYVIPYEADAESFMPDWHLIAQYLVGNAKYLLVTILH